MSALWKNSSTDVPSVYTLHYNEILLINIPNTTLEYLNKAQASPFTYPRDI